MGRGGINSHCATALKQMDHQRHYGYDEQNVNQPSGHVEGGKTKQPRYKQNNEENQKHGKLLSGYVASIPNANCKNALGLRSAPVCVPISK